MAKQQSITSLPRSPDDDRRDRMLKYSITMGIRWSASSLCLFVQGWWLLVCAIGAVVLPYIAVVLANGVTRPPTTEVVRPGAIVPVERRHAEPDARRATRSDAGSARPAEHVAARARDARERGRWNVNWRNPRIHSADRVKIWLACDEHREYLRDYLATRGFPVVVTPLAEHVDVVPDPPRRQAAPSGRPVSGWRILLSRRWRGYLALAVVFAIACGCCRRGSRRGGREAVAADRPSSTPTSSRHPWPLTTALADARLVRSQTSSGCRSTLQRATTCRGRAARAQPPARTAGPGSRCSPRCSSPTARSSSSTAAGCRPGQAGRPGCGARAARRRGHGGRPAEAERAAPRTSRTASGNQIATIQLAEVGASGRADRSTPARTGCSTRRSPSPRCGLTPVLTIRPIADEGPHLSYAIQWIDLRPASASSAWAGRIRQEYRLRNADDPAERARAAGAGNASGR